jgi:hypothetical protein
MPSSRDSSRRNRVAPVVKDNYNTGGKGETRPIAGRMRVRHTDPSSAAQPRGGLLRMTRLGCGMKRRPPAEKAKAL